MNDSGGEPDMNDDDHRYRDCEVCGEPVDTETPPYWKAPNDEQWWHQDCYDE